ncbi:hypothetical protein M3Y98_00411100 [Aphelenchoides besseyi]|nr:hypothetical protein M3Y98_00411100 [Aphelenchoides besseyi]KAI6202042.1 hypothetical protein M3Y96_00906200 [Aphelenchoides besseyi]
MLPYNEPGTSTNNTAYSQYPSAQHTTGHHSKYLNTAPQTQHPNFGRSKPNNLTGSALRAGTDSHYLQQQRNYLPKSVQPQHYKKRPQPPMQPSELHQRRMDTLHSMRKHRSLDGSVFLNELDNPTAQRIPPPPLYDNAEMNPRDPSFNLPHAAYDTNYDQQSYQRSRAYGQPEMQGYPIRYDDISLNPQPPTKMMPQFADDLDSLRRDNMALNQKLNYMMNSIRTFWSPELKLERQQRKDETMRLAAFQDKVMQQAAEIQQIRNELDRREKEIGQLLSDTDLMDMQDELRHLRKHLTPTTSSGISSSRHDAFHHQPTSSQQQIQPRDYTEKSLSAHEIHTLKMKMERSEIALAEKQRELQNAEIKLKNAEEQNSELEKRFEIVSRSNATNESQLKLLQDDLNMLRSKLETRNQLIEGKEKTIKLLEKDLDQLRQQIQETGQGIQTQDHRNNQLQIRVDQLETLLRERDADVERLKQRLLQQPSSRIEQELQQRIENLEIDNRKLLETIDTVRKSGDAEKQQQLQAFQEETRQLQRTIESLQKELSDRQILLASQNEKISQFDSQLKAHRVAEIGGGIDESGIGTTTGVCTRSNLPIQSTNLLTMSSGVDKGKRTDYSNETLQKELEETQKEIGHLLQKIQTLEREKLVLQNKCKTGGYDNPSGLANGKLESSSSLRIKGESSALKMRIDELEEALRESVGITAERDKQITEQKLLIQKISSQVAEAYQDPNRRLRGTGKTDAEQKAWDEERQRYQRQLVNLRKEVTMAAIREKEACIQLLQGPPDSTKEKIEILARQKEQLRHRLLTQNSESYSTGENGPYLANVWLAAQQPTVGDYSNLNAPKTFGKTISSGQRVQPSYSNYVQGTGAGTIQNGIMAGAPTSQVSISIPPYGSVPSAPASFTYGTKIDSADDGIWA